MAATFLLFMILSYVCFPGRPDPRPAFLPKVQKVWYLIQYVPNSNKCSKATSIRVVAAAVVITGRYVRRYAMRPSEERLAEWLSEESSR